MRISDWSSDVCSSDLLAVAAGEILPDPATAPLYVDVQGPLAVLQAHASLIIELGRVVSYIRDGYLAEFIFADGPLGQVRLECCGAGMGFPAAGPLIEAASSEEHTSELQSLMRISSAVFRLKKKKTQLT